MDTRRNQIHHLTTEQLLDYLERRLSPAESTVVEEHLAADCQRCQAEFVWLQDTLNLMVSSAWLDPPAHLQTTARRLFHDHQRSKPGFALGEWLSSLWAQPRALAVAGAAMLILVVIGAGLFWFNQPVSSEVEITASRGTVEVQQAGSDIWVPSSEEVAVQDGSTVRTGDESSIVLTFPDDSKVLVAPDTELSILRMNAHPDGSTRIIVLRQTSGSTHNIVEESSSSASRYEVQTPSALVIVQGTEFTIEVDDAGATRVSVDDGTVTVAAQGVTIALDAGQETTVDKGEEPALVEATPDIPATPLPLDLTEIEDNEVDEVDNAEAVPATEPPATTAPAATESATPTATPTLITIMPSSPTPESIQPSEPTNTPTSPQPRPTETDKPSPTPPPTETPRKSHTPPGLIRTPQPPGQTRNPSSDNSRSSSK